MAFVAVIFTAGSGLLPIAMSPAHAQYQSVANNNVKALRACMAACRARTKACYASGNTGSCKNQHIACIASCQSSISSESRYVPDSLKGHRSYSAR